MNGWNSSRNPFAVIMSALSSYHMVVLAIPYLMNSDVLQNANIVFLILDLRSVSTVKRIKSSIIKSKSIKLRLRFFKNLYSVVLHIRLSARSHEKKFSPTAR